MGHLAWVNLGHLLASVTSFNTKITEQNKKYGTLTKCNQTALCPSFVLNSRQKNKVAFVDWRLFPKFFVSVASYDEHMSRSENISRL